jgi:hypothetical protein
VTATRLTAANGIRLGATVEGDGQPVVPGLDMIVAMRAIVPHLSDAILFGGCGHWTWAAEVTRHLLAWLRTLPAGER